MNLYLIQTGNCRILYEACNKADLIHKLNLDRINFIAIKRIKRLYFSKRDYICGHKLNNYIDSIKFRSEK